MARIMLCFLAICALVAAGCAKPAAVAAPPMPSTQEQRFDALLARNHDLTYEQLLNQTPKRDYLKQLSFDPAEVKYYDEAVKRLQLTDAEQKLLRTNGFVSADHDQAYSFGSLYYAVYTSDLPVLITTDSILYAMHCTYDDMLMEMEQTFFTDALDEVLTNCHEALGKSAPGWGATATIYQDVDLYLTVARCLLKGAGAPQSTNNRRGADAWDGSLPVSSKLDQDRQVKDILDNIQSLTLQLPANNEFTELYGGQRAIDYSQFRPRGHYTKTPELSRYFRAMMWLGRADTAWNILPPDSESGIVCDSQRELRDAMLLTQSMQSTGSIDRLRQMSDILDFMVGESDNLTVFQMLDLIHRQRINNVADLDDSQIEAFQKMLRTGDLGSQRIRSQVVVSDPDDLYQVPPPSVFQLFGQRFVVDSFALSKVVYDSIIFNGKKVERKMPTGLDVMFALGNDSILPLLAQEMTTFPYAANLEASRAFVGQYQPSFWQENLYNIWLDAVRTLSADRSSEKYFPEAMRTEAWQRKQLQTQLASWAELRHNTVLYAKQPNTSSESCEYPTGYVEPYPETYARIKDFADEAARRVEAADFKLANSDHTDIKQRQIEFLKKMAETLGKIEFLAKKELVGEPFNQEEQQWLKTAINGTLGCARQGYTGWYSNLFYRGAIRVAQWDPTVIDVHTDPDSRSVLEEGVGSCNFLVVAIDNADDRMIYVGPAYSYYEFRRPAEQRLTDEEWQQLLSKPDAPARPAWTEAFQGPNLKRSAGK